MTTDLDRAGRRYTAARVRVAQVRHEVNDAIRAAVAEGMPETEAARRAGVDRMTVRRVLGKL